MSVAVAADNKRSPKCLCSRDSVSPSNGQSSFSWWGPVSSGPARTQAGQVATRVAYWQGEVSPLTHQSPQPHADVPFPWLEAEVHPKGTP